MNPRFRHWLLALLLICTGIPALRVQGALTWTYDSAADVPVSTAGYSAGGAASLQLNFAPTAGTTLTVVRNTGPGFIAGVFGNLVQGQAVKLSYNGINYNFVANYHGGTGNDLVLQWANVRAASWGYNADGELGDGTVALSFPYGRRAPGNMTSTGSLAGKVILALAAGGRHSLALCSDGTVAAWGSNFYGQLGNGGTTDSLVPVPVTAAGALAGKTVVAIAAGTYHSLALCSDGTLVAWGRNFEGQLGNGTQDNGLVPVAVTTAGALAGKSVTAIAAGNSHSLALCSDGKAYTWGDNSNGELGDFLYLNSLEPIAVDTTGVLTGKTVTAITAGYYFCLALCSDGTVAGWGYNAQGQMGDNGTTNRFDPVLVDTSGVLSGRTIVSLVSGGFHSLALCSDSTLAAWGDNAYGAIGDASFTDRRVPVVVDVSGVLEGKTIAHVSAGQNHSLARCTDGTLVGWGYHDFGQLGNASTDNSSVPVAVSGSLLASYELQGAAWSGPSGSHSLGLVAALPAPIVDGLDVTSITSTTAVLHGTVNPDNNATTAQFEYGQDTSYGGTASVSLVPDDNNAVQSVSATIPGLIPHALYHYRLTATNSAGTVHTSDGTFTTLYTDADLASLTLSAGTLSPAFSGGVSSYGASVPHSVSSITVTPTVAVSGATVKVEDVPVTSGTASGALSLSVGANVVDVVVDAPGGGVSRIFTITVTRLPLEMLVRGLNMDIANGDAAPAVLDGTDFGGVAMINTQATHAFTIHNGAALPLVLNGTPKVAISGPAAGDFRVVVSPVSSIPSDGDSSFALQFDPKLPGTRSAVVSIAYEESGGQPYTFAVSGFGVLSSRLTQSITFTAPATAYPGQSPLSLNTYASSGLPVTLNVLSGPASVAGHVLTLTGTGTVKVQAVQAGGGNYAAAAPVTRTISVKVNPTTLTLLNLSQIYDGTPRAVSTLGSATPPIITYLVSGAYVSTPPKNASSYKVKAEAGGVTKTGTLVIGKAPLYVTPDDQRKFAGQANPSNLTVRYSGLLGGDTEQTVVTKTPIVKTTATISSPGGQYPIAAAGAVAANYLFIYQRGTMVVESFAGTYEVLLADSAPYPAAKLKLVVAANSKNFTATLSTPWETAGVPLVGTLTTDTGTEQASGTASVTKAGNNTYAIQCQVPLVGACGASATRNGVSLGTAMDGRKRLVLAKGATVPYAGAHTAHLLPATPAGPGTPLGAGWATASISTAGTLTLTGKLPDGTAFTSALSPDGQSNPGYCLFLQPYVPARTGTFVGGAFALVGHPDLSNRRCLPGADLCWVKAARLLDATYRAGFGPVTSVLTIDPWLPPVAAKGSVPAITLAQRLGLTAPANAFTVQHTPTGSAAHINLPTALALNTGSTVTVTAPVTVPANSTKWKVTVNAATGTLTGSFELIDDPTKRSVLFSGVLRQPASTSADTAIGDGHYLLPALPGASSNEKVAGEVLLHRP